MYAYSTVRYGKLHHTELVLQQDIIEKTVAQSDPIQSNTRPRSSDNKSLDSEYVVRSVLVRTLDFESC